MINAVKVSFLLLLACPAFAARLKDVSILSVTENKNEFQLKLHAKAGDDQSYFFVKLIKSGSESEKKMALVNQKRKKGKRYRLDLDIPSFSLSPSGSQYPGTDVKFIGTNRS